MRQLGQLALTLNNDKEQPIGLKEYLKPEAFDNIMEGVRTVARYGQTSKALALPLKLGHLIKKCVEILRGLAIRRNLSLIHI